jgi:hypothetical protein
MTIDGSSDVRSNFANMLVHIMLVHIRSGTASLST